MPVVDAANVARYVAELRHESKVDDVVSIVVPPFRRMFVEAQESPSDLQLRSWGADISILYDRANRDPSNPKAAWVVHLIFYGEWQKNKPVGPLGRYVISLDPNGRMLDEETDRHGGIFGGPVSVGDMDEKAREDFHQRLLRPLTATLLAISFMHCKNVDITP